jgi:hypothetical protein
MDPMTLGILAIALVGGLGAILAFGKGAGALRLLGLGSGGAMAGGVLSIYTKSWALVTGSFYGHLGVAGYAFIGCLGILILIWMWNAYKDFSKNRPIGFVD